MPPIPTRDRDDSTRRDLSGIVTYACLACHATHPAYLFQPNGACKLVLWKATPAVNGRPSQDPWKGQTRKCRRGRKPKRKTPRWDPITPRK